jgi:hypothetical protein
MQYASRSSLLAALLEEVFEQPVEIRSNPGPSLAAALVTERRVSARRAGRVRTTAFLNILRNGC